MNQEVKEKWLVALRSGDYKQSKFKLKDGDNGFCCLGVLSDLYAKEKGLEWTESEAVKPFKTVSCISETTPNSDEYLAKEVMEWAGLDKANPNVDVVDYCENTLAEFNDDCEFDFDRIAEIIEEQL